MLKISILTSLLNVKKVLFRNFKLNNFYLVYINHRPAFGLNPADLNQAFNILSDANHFRRWSTANKS